MAFLENQPILIDNFGSTLSSVRVFNALTRQKLADLLNIPTKLLKDWESELKLPTQKQVMELAKALKVPTSFFVKDIPSRLSELKQFNRQEVSSIIVESGEENNMEVLGKLGGESLDQPVPLNSIQLGEVLYNYRKTSPYTFDEIAKSVGISMSAIRGWEQGLSTPNAKDLNLLAKKFKTTIDQLMGIPLKATPKQYESLRASTFESCLKALRQQEQLSRDELGQAIKTSPVTIRMWETGKSKPGLGKVIEISNHFNVSISFLMNGNPTLAMGHVEIQLTSPSSQQRELFARHLKEFRLKKQMGPTTLARRIGSNYATVTSWESGHKIPGVKLLSRLAETLNVQPEDFFKEDDVVMTVEIDNCLTLPEKEMDNAKNTESLEVAVEVEESPSVVEVISTSQSDAVVIPEKANVMEKAAVIEELIEPEVVDQVEVNLVAEPKIEELSQLMVASKTAEQQITEALAVIMNNTGLLISEVQQSALKPNYSEEDLSLLQQIQALNDESKASLRDYLTFLISRQD